MTGPELTGPELTGMETRYLLFECASWGASVTTRLDTGAEPDMDRVWSITIPCTACSTLARKNQATYRKIIGQEERQRWAMDRMR